MIRPARADEFPLLAAIEDAAAQMFRGTSMAFMLAADRKPVAQAVSTLEPVFTWVAVDNADQPVGFLEAEIIEGWLHILEVSVHPAHGRKGFGRALVDCAVQAAHDRKLSMVSLTTNRDIAWNGPAYARMGFRELPLPACPPWLGGIIAYELSIGFDPALRIAMAQQP